MQSILQIQEVSKQYGDFFALQDVSIEIQPGRIFGLLGPNGAGKTSLIRIINGITAPDKGVVLFNGTPISPEINNRLGYLPEERGLYKKMKVGELSLYLAQLKGLSKKDALTQLEFWFEKFDISQWWHKKIEELSKGMQQKIQFIVSVVHNPALLILDEPFSGFDPINAALIKEEILGLKSKGTSIILSTHNMSSVEEICDDIALIYKSKKILDGSVASVRNERKENLFEIVFQGEITMVSQALWIDAQLVSHQKERNMTKARVKMLNQRSANDLLKALLPFVEIHELKEVVPSMNEVFVNRVNEIQNTTYGA
jgi:ABC-2 type transport system ATP-binding protein